MIKKLLNIFSSFKLKYIPLLAIYFANSFAAFTKIAETYWLKDSFSLTPSEITSIAIWSNLPWTMKIIFGQFLDSVRIRESQRYIYVYFAALILSFGIIINISIANDFAFIRNFSKYSLLILSGAFIQLGLALQDLVADTLCYDAVDKYDDKNNQLSDDKIKDEIGKVQIIVKITDIIAAMFAAIISGFIASRYSYADISYFSLIIVIISILGIMIYPKEPFVKLEKFNPQIIYGGILYLSFILFIALLKINNSDIFILTIGALIISYLLYKLCKPLESSYKIEICKMLLIIFAFRAAPLYGPGVEWWQIDELKFTPNFISILDQITIIFGFIGVLCLSEKFINMGVVKALLVLKILHVLFNIPIIAMSLGFHNWIIQYVNITAKELILFSSIADGLFLKLEFMIICFAATYYAPKQNIATWFALFMSLISIAYIGAGRVLKRILADNFIIERGKYDNIAELVIATNLINILLPISVIIICKYVFKSKN